MFAIIAGCLTVLSYVLVMSATDSTLLAMLVAVVTFVVSFVLSAVFSAAASVMRGSIETRNYHREMLKRTARVERNLRRQRKLIAKIKQGDMYDNRSVTVHLHTDNKE